MTEANPLDRLALEKRRTLFLLYGWLDLDGNRGETAYFKQAYSLQMALDDMQANAGVLDTEYRVVDVIVVEEEDGTDFALHVELEALPEPDLELREFAPGE